MADVKISALPASAGLATVDLFPVVDDPGGAPATQRATIAQLITLLDTVFVNAGGDTMTGPLLFSLDNTHDIGAAGATRPRTVHFGTSAIGPFGSAAVPTYSFNTQTNYGMFNSGGSLDFSAAGTRIAAIQPAGLFVTTGALTTFTADGKLQIGSAGDVSMMRNAAGIIEVNNGTAGTFRDLWARHLRLATAFTVATLPAAGVAGRMAYVTDATAPTFLGALVGGGAVVTPVFDNGAAWVSA